MKREMAFLDDTFWENLGIQIFCFARKDLARKSRWRLLLSDPATSEADSEFRIGEPDSRSPADHITIRIPQAMVSGAPLVLGLRTRM